ncbi:MAG: hypothetical protein AAF420_12255, partial [Pseudomonadota bacterium]
QFDDHWSTTGQVVSVGADDYDVEVEWAYLSYHVNDSLTWRAGRMRRPLYAFSDYLYVGYAYPWIRPPLEVYSPELRSYDGVDAIDLYYQTTFGDWDLGLQAYYGNSSGRAEVDGGEVIEYKTRDDIGLVFELDDSTLNFRLGYHRLPATDVATTSATQVLLDSLEFAGFSTVADELRTDDIESNFYSIAVGMDQGEWFMQFEYTALENANSIAADETSWYLMGGWRLDSSTVHFTYSEREREQNQTFSDPIYSQATMIAPFDPGAAAALNALGAGVDFAATRTELEQYSYTLGIRCDLDYPAALKVEWQRIFDEQYNLRTDVLSVGVDVLF